VNFVQSCPFFSNPRASVTLSVGACQWELGGVMTGVMMTRVMMTGVVVVVKARPSSSRENAPTTRRRPSTPPVCVCGYATNAD